MPLEVSHTTDDSECIEGLILDRNEPLRCLQPNVGFKSVLLIGTSMHSANCSPELQFTSTLHKYAVKKKSFHIISSVTKENSVIQH